MGWGSGIQKKPIQDPGSGSATLVNTKYSHLKKGHHIKKEDKLLKEQKNLRSTFQRQLLDYINLNIFSNYAKLKSLCANGSLLP
jgi:hypothetical protein